VLRPAKKSIDMEISNVLLVNRVPKALKKADGEYLYNTKKGKKDSVHYNNYGGYYALDCLSERLNENPRFKSVFLHKDIFSESFNKSINLSKRDLAVLDSIRKKSEVDAIIFLDWFDFQKKYRKKRLPYTGKKVYEKEKLFTAKATFRIFDLKDKVYIDQDSVNEGYIIPMNYLSPRHPDGSKTSLMKDLACKVAETYASEISPLWDGEQRFYYTGSPTFKVADKYASQQKWKEAAKIWQQYTDHPNSKIAGMALHNMAFASEMTGNLNVAVEWAEKAYNVNKSKVEAKYLKQLRKRKEEQKKLELQLN